MMQEEADKLIDDINTEGTVAYKQYKIWKQSRMTQKMVSLMQYLSTPDKALNKIVAIPGTGGDAACSLIGVLSGRAQCLDEMMTIDSYITSQDPDADAVEDFSN